MAKKKMLISVKQTLMFLILTLILTGGIGLILSNSSFDLRSMAKQENKVKTLNECANFNNYPDVVTACTSGGCYFHPCARRCIPLTHGMEIPKTCDEEADLGPTKNPSPKPTKIQGSKPIKP